MQTPAESMPHCLSQNRGSTRLDRLIGELRDRRQQLGETQLSALQTLIDEVDRSLEAVLGRPESTLGVRACGRTVVR
jgi:hypothetical protein